jgi:hypothetical protein
MECLLLYKASNEPTSDYLYLAGVTNHGASTNIHTVSTTTMEATNLLATACIPYITLTTMPAPTQSVSTIAQAERDALKTICFCYVAVTTLHAAKHTVFTATKQ